MITTRVQPKNCLFSINLLALHHECRSRIGFRSVRQEDFDKGFNDQLVDLVYLLSISMRDS